MRKAAAVVALLLFLAVTIRVHSQTRNTTPLSKDYIEIIGANLRLGMTSAEVDQKLSGVEITKVSTDDWLVKTGNDEHSLQFENGRLTFADRRWHGQDDNIVDALFSVVSYFNNQGHTNCSVYTDTVPEPYSRFERVWIACGDKSILIVRSTINNKHYEWVEEQLGVLKRDSK